MTEFRFAAEIIHWRGPSPFFFAPLPPDHAEEIKRLSKLLTYGWGVIPVDATICGVSFYTSLFPKDDTYLLPLKDAVRKKTGITAGDMIFVEMALRPPRR
ncbi:DUF1905 domain-containing protein [Neorhizobium galegae]|uniref:DUF1905 domain-containing protein n=1 Tax=Neorhizobium galegae TaxID=399 RepID=UPI0012796269|nr:DUF1905 domain-containing protein [Neorhizobium galegae]KAA9387919.1 DUF1905 domain-containing protein [Neorhizobium galegae]KAB1115610.1 DUF1905 domain-containing protein [Neorhizobium galegae]MCM2501613.1 DUF1905 domain-containing protein [Neorhizobium galegae]MCQ1774115.1 DUF1905 domain-containing protein [Neorhizobium galegae]MCQ1800358.1 DUF1905 domain-containing protein [Neorhizobium galegae]